MENNVKLAKAEVSRGEDVFLYLYEGKTIKEVLIKSEYFDEENWTENWEEQFTKDEKYRFVLANGDTVEIFDDGEVILCLCDNIESAKTGCLLHYSNTLITHKLIIKDEVYNNENNS